MSDKPSGSGGERGSQQKDDDRSREDQRGGSTSQEAAAAPSTADTTQLLAALTEVFRSLQGQVQHQAAPPAAGAAVEAARVFGDLQASLQPRLVPLAPRSVTADAISSTEVRLQWSDASGDVEGFRIRRCQGRDCKDFADIASRVPAGETSFRDRDLTGAMTYRYQVIAFNSVGASDASEVAAATTLKA